MKERTKPFGMIFRKKIEAVRDGVPFIPQRSGAFTTKVAEFPRLIRKFSDRFLCYIGKYSPFSRPVPHYGMLTL
jgi:hypothetical protein